MLEDPFGRIVDIRSDGLVRSNGLLGHPFLSVAVCAIGYIIARHKKNKLIITLAIVAFISNQTLRSYSTLFILLFFDFISNKILKQKLRFLIYISSSIIYSSIIYYLVITSESASNQLRSLVWFNSIGKILESPWIGNKGFKAFNIENGLNAENLINSGISENIYLDLALHFGAPLAFAFLLLLIINIYRNVMLTYSNISLRSKNELLGAILFVDSLYGNLITVSFFIIYIFISNSGRNYDQKLYLYTKYKKAVSNKHPKYST
jgi:O-antigen ligase